MAKLPYMPLYVADYLRDTRCLALPTRGAWMDMLCALWNAPKRGLKKLTLDGWAGEVGRPSSEVSLAIIDLEQNRVGKIIRKKNAENVEEITIMSLRMIRDEALRKRKAKQKQDQRDKRMSPPLSHPCPQNVEAMSPGYIRVRSQSQKSESEEESGEEKKEERKTKICGQVKTVPAVAKSTATWHAYATAYRARYGVEPVRNQKTNALLCQLVDRLGVTDAPTVAEFYLSHNSPLYVRGRHPPNLLVRDAEGLRTQWATGTKATSTEIRQAEVQDDAREQVKRVEAMLAKGL